jgi:hypothetical protein
MRRAVDLCALLLGLSTSAWSAESEAPPADVPTSIVRHSEVQGEAEQPATESSRAGLAVSLGAHTQGVFVNVAGIGRSGWGGFWGVATNGQSTGPNNPRRNYVHLGMIAPATSMPGIWVGVGVGMKSVESADPAKGMVTVRDLTVGGVVDIQIAAAKNFGINAAWGAGGGGLAWSTGFSDDIPGSAYSHVGRCVQRPARGVEPSLFQRMKAVWPGRPGRCSVVCSGALSASRTPRRHTPRR